MTWKSSLFPNNKYCCALKPAQTRKGKNSSLSFQNCSCLESILVYLIKINIPLRKPIVQHALGFYNKYELAMFWFFENIHILLCFIFGCCLPIFLQTVPIGDPVHCPKIWLQWDSTHLITQWMLLLVQSFCTVTIQNSIYLGPTWEPLLNVQRKTEHDGSQISLGQCTDISHKSLSSNISMIVVYDKCMSYIWGQLRRKEKINHCQRSGGNNLHAYKDTIKPLSSLLSGLFFLQACCPGFQTDCGWVQGHVRRWTDSRKSLFTQIRPRCTDLFLPFRCSPSLADKKTKVSPQKDNDFTATDWPGGKKTTIARLSFKRLFLCRKKDILVTFSQCICI